MRPLVKLPWHSESGNSPIVVVSSNKLTLLLEFLLPKVTPIFAVCLKKSTSIYGPVDESIPGNRHFPPFLPRPQVFQQYQSWDSKEEILGSLPMPGKPSFTDLSLIVASSITHYPIPFVKIYLKQTYSCTYIIIVNIVNKDCLTFSGSWFPFWVKNLLMTLKCLVNQKKACQSQFW